MSAPPMKRRHTALLRFVVAVALVGVALALFRSLERERRSVRPTPAEGGQPATDPASAERDLQSTPGPGRQAVDGGVGDGAGESPGSAPVAAPGDYGVVSGMVVDASGVGVPDATVTLYRAPGRDSSNLDPAHYVAEELVSSTAADGAGHFNLSARRGVAYMLGALAPGLVESRVHQVRAGMFVTVRLNEGATLAGRVVYEPDGDPVGACVFRGLTGDAGEGGFVEVVADASGYYEFQDLASGALRVSVHPPRGLEASFGVVLTAGQVTRKEVRISRGITLNGVVRDAVTRAGIGDAEVALNWAMVGALRTDSSGKFRFDEGMPRDEVSIVHARAPGYGRAEVRLLPDERDEAEVVLDLWPGVELTGVVTSSVGLPVENAYVAAIAWVGGEDLNRHDWVAARTDASGRFVLDDVRSDLPHQLLVEAEGFGRYLAPVAIRGSATSDVGTIVLQPAASIVGRLVDEAGSAVPGRRVALTLVESGGGFRYLPGETFLHESEARSGSDGSFDFFDLGEGRYRLEVRGAGPRSAPTEVVLEEAEVEEVEVEIQLHLGQTMAGVVRAPDGSTCANVHLRFSPQGGGRSITVVTGAHGEFEVTGFRDTTYKVSSALLTQFWKNDPRKLGRAELQTAPTLDLEIELPWASELAGTVYLPTGKPAVEAMVMALSDGNIVAAARSSAEGHYTLHVPPDGVFVLTASLDDVAVEREGVRATGERVDLNLQ